jgi:hypothetical protein
MKKLFFFAVVTAAVAMFGVRTGIVHAQTVTTNTENTAALQQELDVAKATLINLEMQAGMIPAGDSQLGTGATATASTAAPAGTQVTTGISASQAAYFNGVLSQLGTALVDLKATLQANPNMNATQIAAIASTLGSMQGTVSTISGEIAQANQGSPVAVTTPTPSANTGSAATPAAGNGATTKTQPATGVAQAAPATTSPAAGASTGTASNPVQTTAQASSIWSFTASNWPVLAIILLVLAILAILFWPEKEAKAPTVQKAATPSSPKAPSVAQTATQSSADTQAKPTAQTATTASTPGAPQGSTKVA